MFLKLSDNDCVEILVHICEKLEFYLIDRGPFNEKYCSPQYSIVRYNDMSDVKCYGVDLTYYAFFMAMSPVVDGNLESSSAAQLLAKFCSARAFYFCDIPDLCYPNPFYGIFGKLKDVASLEEAIILLDLYVQH